MPTFRVPVSPAVLDWAVQRSGVPLEDIHHKFPDLEAWREGIRQPTFNQLEKLAHTTHTPFGTFFLNTPPVDDVPIPDFRTMANAGVSAPSPDLLETIFICQQRQEWYREHALISGAEPLGFIGSASIRDSVSETAQRIREQLRFSSADRRQDPTWADALRRLIDSAEDAGILVMVSGIVGNNTHRGLDPDEFRGFALSDALAPLVFINGADTKAAQIFTLIHEVAHLWIGQTALSDVPLDHSGGNETELWCNKVAAEVLVPLESLRSEFRGRIDPEELDRLAKLYKVSTLVVMKRIYDAGAVPWDAYRVAYQEELQRVLRLLSRRDSTGGNFYYTHPLRISRRFARAVISDASTGRTLHRDAFRLLGTRKYETFVNLGKQVGVA
jgi:Zn-dependent peptidase ImmA (M78 family)